MNIGKRLKAYREYHQLTQEDLATKAGVNEKYYGRIERNESCPTVDKLEKICTALGIELSELPISHKTRRPRFLVGSTYCQCYRSWTAE